MVIFKRKNSFFPSLFTNFTNLAKKADFTAGFYGHGH